MHGTVFKYVFFMLSFVNIFILFNILIVKWFFPSLVYFKWFYSQTDELLDVQIFLVMSVK